VSLQEAYNPPVIPFEREKVWHNTFMFTGKHSPVLPNQLQPLSYHQDIVFEHNFSTPLRYPKGKVIIPPAACIIGSIIV
jgi:hypothetical protein